MKLKLAVAAVLAATFVVVAGCGSDDASSTDKQQDTDDITALVADINQVTKDRDAQGFCALMQPTGVTEVFNTQSQCVRETATILKQDRGKQPELKIEDITIDGNDATVTLVNNAGGAPIDLVKEGGKWYVPLGKGETSSPTDGTELPQ
ncbi:MAG: hypothetical protein IPK93_07980 [Solirubrobacterales bacterium]|nr:hypothetical protein [Solirubrobacterales bacterium]